MSWNPPSGAAACHVRWFLQVSRYQAYLPHAGLVTTLHDDGRVDLVHVQGELPKAGGRARLLHIGPYFPLGIATLGA